MLHGVYSTVVNEMRLLAIKCPARGSMSKFKISGDKGQPCWVPLVIWNSWVNMSSVKTCADGIL